MNDSLPPRTEIEISPGFLLPFLEAKPSSIRLIDCREEDEFAICNIEGAELIPLSRFAEEAAGKLLNETNPVVVYCHHGMRSLQATGFLRNKGIEQVWSLNGGIDRWSLEIDPSVPRY
jgi:adenylyltransferase/sulfurtransferase